MISIVKPTQNGQAQLMKPAYGSPVVSLCRELSQGDQESLRLYESSFIHEIYFAWRLLGMFFWFCGKTGGGTYLGLPAFWRMAFHLRSGPPMSGRTSSSNQF
jgi:hypothetical protein